MAAPFSSWLSSVSLDAAGLVALADLDTIARRTALTGTSDLLDSFILCPGLHRQQTATHLHNGENPPMAAMLTGYICRVENPATVSYLQEISRTGTLTVVKVQKRAQAERPLHKVFSSTLNASISCPTFGATTAYLSVVMITCGVILLLALLRSWKGLCVIAALMFSRLLNVAVIRRRSVSHWHGALEPGTQADNLILLAQDRWVRMQGDIDDVKAVTSGQWLQRPTFIDGATTALATVIVYVTAALTSNVEAVGKVAILILLLVSVGLLSIANELTNTLRMHGRTVSVQEPRQPFDRRLSMVSSLIDEVGRGDWAARLGLVVEAPHHQHVQNTHAIDSDKV